MEESRKMTEEERNAYNKYMQYEINKQRLSEITKDFAQVFAGIVIPNLEEKKAEFKNLLNEVRIYEGKTSREEV